jgi:DtxR family Mn-dependent transcriptional regulator
MSAADFLPLLAVAAAAAALILLWPRTGLLARRRGAERDAERVQVEDALKHLHDCEERRVSCTRESIAGALGVGGDAAADLLARLTGLGLLESHDDRFTLTGAGRAYALRVIRLHRLWERHLADETGLPEVAWHPSAEQAEHRLSAAEAEALAVRMGHPRYDPHGDPIPTPSGELPAPRGVPLSRLGAGEVAAVVHLEDEPTGVYARLVGLGLHPGVRLRVVETDGADIRFEAEGHRHTVPRLLAANVTVALLPAETEIRRAETTLDALAVGDRGAVVSLSPACRGMQRRRLMDMGVVPGSVITVEMRSPGGDPTAYRIRGAVVALRADHARMILVDTVKEAG